MADLQLTEAQFQDQVVDLARLHGYRVAHFRPARTEKGWRTPVAADGAGWPDLVLVKPGRMIFAELKSQRGRLSDDQHAWLDQLRAAGVEAYVWRPAQFDDIDQILRGNR
jgi:hypothetical protein